eukprot:c12001_g1_i1.p1 GENE.c12001_g1_i1~~c12001_g1_i1.p1  ORF type:complete len:247 (+),score=86.20 c12001_g1_i1:83-823(+)
MCRGLIPQLNQTPESVRVAEKAEYLLEQLVNFNEHQGCTKAVGKAMIKSASPFAEQWVYEDILVKEFLDYLGASVLLDDDCYIYALCLLKKIEKSSNVVPITQRTVHRLFFTCLVLGFRFMDDRRFADQEFATICSLSLDEFRNMQLWVLKTLKFNCFIQPEELVMMKNKIDEVYLGFDSCVDLKKNPNILTLTLIVDGVDIAQQKPIQEKEFGSKMNGGACSFIENIRMIGNRDGLHHSLSSIFS